MMPSVSQQLDRLADWLIEDILATPDEEILAEAAEDGEDVDALTLRMRRMIDKVRREIDAEPDQPA